MSSKETLTAKVEEDLKEAVESYGDRNGLTKSKATVKLLRVGLRETKSPMLYRVKQQAKDAAFYLSLVAVVTVVIGRMTTALEVGNAIQIAIVLLAFAVAPLAMVVVGQLALDRLARPRGGKI